MLQLQVSFLLTKLVYLVCLLCVRSQLLSLFRHRMLSKLSRFVLLSLLLQATICRDCVKQPWTLFSRTVPEAFLNLAGRSRSSKDLRVDDL
mmetsp:Transcript_90541/g.260976  ORF Transcript_90541/g.260976 Transcript_90541/m.260976 type:complete len:91 (-) Transcript_90541:445-717(-)